MSESLKDDGGPAFAVPFTQVEVWCHGKNPVHGYPGMSLRDYFAAKAMQACIDDSWRAAEAAELVPYAGDLAAGIASDAYALADAMLAQRQK